MPKIQKQIAGVFATLFGVALITTFVLPGRPSPQVITAFFDGLSSAVRSTLGIGPEHIARTNVAPSRPPIAINNSVAPTTGTTAGL